MQNPPLHDPRLIRFPVCDAAYVFICLMRITADPPLKF